MRRFSAVVFSVVTLTAACCAVVAGTALPAGASEPAVSAWGTAQQVPGLAALSTGSWTGGFESEINALSCGSAGSCAAGGGYVNSADNEQAFVVDESGWSWGTAQQVPGLAALSTGVYPVPGYTGDGITSVITALSCPSAGSCAAGGVYADSAGHRQAFVVDESGGSWGTAQAVPGLAALNAGGAATISSVSCGSAGNCAAGGTYTDSSGHDQAFVVDETGGSWDSAEEVPGLAGLNAAGDAGIGSVSCASAGNCAAGGWYEAADTSWQAFVVDETGGIWGAAQEVPGSAALNTYETASVDSVSCPSAGNCTAVGYVGYTPHCDGGIATPQALMRGATPETCLYNGVVPAPFVVDETGGIWGNAKLTTGTGVNDSVSCWSAGNCVAVGNEQPDDDQPQPDPVPMMAEESSGSWGAAQAIPGLAALGSLGGAVSVSCPSAGNCAAGGTYDYDSPQVFVVAETGGSWGAAEEVPGSAALNAGGNASLAAVSCASAGNCAAGGTYTGASGIQQAFVVSEKPATSTDLALSAAKVTYGKEQAERVSATVSAASGATPAGTVTVKAGAVVVCGSVSISAGRASCTVAATKLPAGTWHLSASYSGSDGLAPSASAAGTLTVDRAASKVTLSLSAGRVTYGKEGSERLTVKVTGQYAGTPTGKVTVKSGKTTVCTITLAAGKGSCTLSARELPAGTRTLTADYGGSSDFTGAASAPKTLKVVT